MAISQQLYLAGMSRSLAAIIALVAMTLIVAAQDRPHVSLALPSGIASEAVQIEYFLTGAFGGYGGFVKPEKGRASYDIDPFVEGSAAKNVKVIAYLPGCEISTLDFTFSGATVERTLDCYPPGQVAFRGQVLQSSGTMVPNGEIEVNYLATWAFKFYGIKDGPVTTFCLGKVRPDAEGNFEIMLPDLYKQSRWRDGELEFILRDSKTGNILAFLRPEDAAPNSPKWLAVQSSYPIVRLVAENQQPQTGQ
jgi:hypothetical protein